MAPTISRRIQLNSHSQPQETDSVGLPGHYYTSAEIFAQEQNTIWPHTWQWVGRDQEIPHPGDFLTCMVGGEPIVVVRQPDQSLRAMHNVCAHRGARLLDGTGHIGRMIRCPYHAWTYRLDGQLIGVSQPRQFPTLDPACIQLVTASVDSWGGFIFVNPDAQPESLTHYLAGIPAFFQQYEYPWHELREVSRWSYQEPINWKFIVENYAEDYHFSVVHPQSLSLYDLANISLTVTGRHCHFHIPYSPHEPYPDLASMWSAGRASYQGYVFPNLMLNTECDHVSVFRLIPLSPIETRIDVVIYQTPKQQEQHALDLDQLRQSHDQVMAEDFEVCRLLQAGVNSRAYRVTQLATEREQGIAHFYQTIREYLNP